MTNLSRQQTKPTTVQVGDRVRVKEYAGSSDPLYIGLEGLITGIDQRKDRWVIIVLLDNDPNPVMQMMLGGLPCYEYELEKL
jgi:hypothetical protein